MQGNRFSDALCFISVGKSFAQKFKAGIKTAVMLSRPFTYQGTEIKDGDFFSHSEGNISLPLFPVWFNFRYEFSLGRKLEKIERTREEIDKMPE